MRAMRAWRRPSRLTLRKPRSERRKTSSADTPRSPATILASASDFAVTLLTRVGGLNLARLIGDLPVSIELEL